MISRETLEEARTIFKLAWPVMGAHFLILSMVSEMAFFGASTLVMGIIGIRELASHQIALNAASITFMIPLGLSIAASIRIGQKVGQGDEVGVLRTGKASLLLTLLIQSLSGLCFLLFPGAISRIYTSDTDIIIPAARFIFIAGAERCLSPFQTEVWKGDRHLSIPRTEGPTLKGMDLRHCNEITEAFGGHIWASSRAFPLIKSRRTAVGTPPIL